MIAPVQVDVWLLASAGVQRDTLDACLAGLLPDEREQAARFVVDDARRQFVLARTLLRRVLSDAAGVPPAAWVFERNHHGKPRIASPVQAGGLHFNPEHADGLHFNVSHTPGLVAVAVCRGTELGVDVECTTRELDLASLASALFAPVERAHFDGLPAPESRDYFFSIWTLKEAYVKARGMGLSLSLDTFSFDIGPTAPRVAFSNRCPDVPRRWHFVRADPTPVHKLALALPVPAAPALALALAIRWTSATKLADALTAN